MWIVLLLAIYAIAFMIVAWPIHWIWYSRTQKGPYDQQFYNYASYWRVYAIVFGGAIVLTVLVNILRAWW